MAIETYTLNGELARSVE